MLPKLVDCTSAADQGFRPTRFTDARRLGARHRPGRASPLACRPRSSLGRRTSRVRAFASPPSRRFVGPERGRAPAHHVFHSRFKAEANSLSRSSSSTTSSLFTTTHLSKPPFALTPAPCRPSPPGSKSVRQPRHIADSRYAGQLALLRESVGEPGSLAWHVIVDPLESLAFEAPRGPWAHVSKIVVAVDDLRRSAVESRSGLPVELL
jgi:hypothetical protein